jgi:flagellar protein FliL
MATKAAPSTPESALENTAPKSKKKLMLSVILAIAIAAGSGAAWFFFFKPTDPEGGSPAKHAAQAGPPVFVVLDPFTVNLQPEGQFLQASFTLQMETPEDSQNLKNYLPQVRSRLLMLLSSSHANELATPEGKNKLILEITENVQQPFSEGMKPVKVLNVFITAFVIQ